MRGWIILLLIGMGALAVAAVAFLQRRDNEPSYNGVPLSDCLRATLRPSAAGTYKAINALEKIDTNAIPYLLQSIQYERPTWRIRLARVIYKVPPAAVAHPVAGWIARVERWELAQGALDGFLQLKGKADAATDALGAMLDNRQAPETAHRAMLALEAIGTTNSFVKIVGAIQHRDNPYRTDAVLIALDILHENTFRFSDSFSNAVFQAAPDVFTNGNLYFHLER
jgi:hypothetical protein